MPTTITIERANLEITINRRISPASHRQWLGVLARTAHKIDRNTVIDRVDRAISIGGAAAIIMSILYFAPILASLLAANP